MLSNALLQEVESILKVTEFNEFQTLKDRWNNFLSESLNNNVFSTWEWLSTWWKHFGEGKKLVILLIEDKNKILAVAPFVHAKYSFLGFGNLKKISFVGSPQSDYTDFILKEKKEKYLEILFDYLNDHIDWNYMQLEDIPETTVSVDLLRRICTSAPLKKRFTHYKERMCTPCPYLPLPNSMETFMERLSKNMRRSLRRHSRKLRKKYHVKLKKYDEIGPVKEAMEIFCQLHQKRWESKGIQGGFSRSNKAFLDFHMDIAKSFAKKGWLGLYFLTVNDEAIAAKYTFEYGQKMYSYLGGWDPEYSQYGVGNLMNMYLIENCIRKGMKEYDMMRGAEPYKSKFATVNRKNFEVILIQNGLHCRIYDWLIKKEAFAKLIQKLGLHHLTRAHN